MGMDTVTAGDFRRGEISHMTGEQIWSKYPFTLLDRREKPRKKNDAPFSTIKQYISVRYRFRGSYFGVENG